MNRPGAQPHADCWVHPATEIQPFPIEGNGLFTVHPLRTGIVVIEFGGRLVTSVELMALMASSEMYVDSVTVGHDVHLVLPPGTAAHFANHSCVPNLRVHEQYRLVTCRSVAAGEELTVDYATVTGAPGKLVPCRCGAAACRGTVTI